MLKFVDGLVYRTEDNITAYIGREKEFFQIAENTYQWHKFNVKINEYEVDQSNTDLIEINEVKYTPVNGKVTVQRQPQEIDILGEQVVDIELQNFQLAQENAILGGQVVALELKNMELIAENQMHGQQLVDMDLRVLNLEIGGIASE